MAVALDLADLVGPEAAAISRPESSNSSNVSTITFGSDAPTFAKIVGFEQFIENSNIGDDDSFAWVLSPNVKAKWRQTLKAPSASELV
jgi:hypothetical protein